MRHYFTQTKSSLARGGSQLISNTIIPLVSANQSLPQALNSNYSLNATKSTSFELNQGVQEMNRNMFIGKWIGGYGRPEQIEEPIDMDISDIEFEAEEMGWGGLTRPGTNWDEQEMNENTGISDEECSDNDDDHHGGEMMPIPRLF